MVARPQRGFLVIDFGPILGVLLVLTPPMWVALSYNRFVAQRNGVRTTWAGVDVQLQRRHDLIPNLVETVRGYAAHERAVFENVTRIREEARRLDLDPGVSPAGQAPVEDQLSAATRQLFAVAEAYPDLRASDNFLHLQRQLVETEDRLAAARRLYNIEVMELNRRVESVPSNIIAGWFGFERADFFELRDPGATSPPEVSL